MVAQVQTRDMLSKNESGKPASIFVKKSNSRVDQKRKTKDRFYIKIKNINKKCDPKKLDDQGPPKAQNDKYQKEKGNVLKETVGDYKSKRHDIDDVVDKHKEVKSMHIETPSSPSIDMLSILA